MSSIELKVNNQASDFITASSGKQQIKEVVYDPSILVTTSADGLLSYIDIEICHDSIYYTSYITDVVNALIPGEYSVPEFGWNELSAAEIFVLLLMKGYNITEYTDWTDALPDKGERIKGL